MRIFSTQRRKDAKAQDKFQMQRARRISLYCNAYTKLRLQHRGAMPEGSRGLSDQRERHPRKTFSNKSIPEGCQTFCDLSEVVNSRVLSGGVGIPLAQDASTPGYLLSALRADGTTSPACKKARCASPHHFAPLR